MVELGVQDRERLVRTHACVEQLADHGFAWRDIARVVGVKACPQFTKWRKGAGVTGENRLNIARLLPLRHTRTDSSASPPPGWKCRSKPEWNHPMKRRTKNETKTRCA